MNSMSYAQLVVENVLKAMSLGSQRATNFFPRLLQLIDEFDSCRNPFKDNVSWLIKHIILAYGNSGRIE